MTKGAIEGDRDVGASLESCERVLDLVRRALRARRSFIRCHHELERPAGLSRLEFHLIPDDRCSAVLVAEDDEGRDWSDDDRCMLRGLADTLAAEMRLRAECERQRAIVDHLPGLVYERRKTGPAQARYTFIGPTKATLPAVRELMEGGVEGAPLRFVHRDDREAVRSALLRSTVEESDLDLVFRIKDFEGIRWVRSASVARREDDGSLVWSGLCIDVTDLVERAEATGVEDRPQATADADTRGSGDLVHCAAENGDVDDRPVRILIADDLDLNRKLIADMLSLEGWVCETVADGAAAVEAVRTNPFDLVFMDMIMPDMDGLDATRAIRGLPAPACDVPIVALTAHSFREQLDSCIEAGMNATLVKPMSFEMLFEAVNTWSRHRQPA